MLLRRAAAAAIAGLTAVAIGSVVVLNQAPQKPSASIAAPVAEIWPNAFVNDPTPVA